MSQSYETCPECGSQNVSGLVMAFWVLLPNSYGSVNWEEESEVGEDRLCHNCGYNSLEELPSGGIRDHREELSNEELLSEE